MNERPSSASLPPEELERSPLSLVDEAGTVFFARDRIFRAVGADAEARVRALLESGLIEALADKGWAPRCWESDVSIAGYTLVLEQERVPVVSYPFEWTYAMLRDAAIRVLEVNDLARSYGWELQDCHGYNLVFDGPNPLWVDMGSFVPCAVESRGWPAYEEFVRFYEYALRIWRHGGGFIAVRLIAVGQLMNHVDYGLYRHPILRWAGTSTYERLVRRWYQVRRWIRTPDERIMQRLGPVAGRLVCACKRRGWVPGNLSSAAVRRRVNRPRRILEGYWSSYQAAGPESVATPRFDRIAALLREMKARSVVELGGNQGWFSERLLREGIVERATCLDADELAIDRGYERARRSGARINFGVVNFVVPMVNPNGSAAPEERFRADAVLVLAVTHHLLLSQQMPIDRVMRNLAGYTQRLALVEFMPMGLYDGHRPPPPVPAWYHVDWFRQAFLREFKLVREEVLGSNRHLFCGERLAVVRERR